MTNKIKILLLTVMLSSSIPMSAQIYGGDYALPMPTRDIYDTDMMIASLNAARIASEYDSRLLDYLEPIMNDLSQNLRAGNYNTCISKVNDVFRNVTFYKYQSFPVLSYRFLLISFLQPLLCHLIQYIVYQINIHTSYA